MFTATYDLVHMYVIRNKIQDIGGAKNLHEIYHEWAQPIHSRFQRDDPRIEIWGRAPTENRDSRSSRQNICQRRDPKCYFDLIPKRNIKNQLKTFVMFQDLVISLHGKNNIARESRAISVLNCSDIVVQVSFCYRYQ